VSRDYKIVTDVFGREVKVPTTEEHGDWIAKCQTCGYRCGGTFGHPPDEDSCKYTYCPWCRHSGEPNVIWEPV
jgi:hypothetical protein